MELEYTIGRYGSLQEAQRIADLKEISLEELCKRTYANKPKIKYAGYQICCCGSAQKQVDNSAVCTRKQCYRSKHPLDKKTAKIAFIEGETTVTEIDSQAGNKAVFNKDGVVHVIRRDHKTLI